MRRAPEYEALRWLQQSEEDLDAANSRRTGSLACSDWRVERVRLHVLRVKNLHPHVLVFYGLKRNG